MSLTEGDCSPGGTIAIIGGGASGMLATIHLVARAKRPVDIILIESCPKLGEGTAFSTPERHHLLNSPTCEMSAWSALPYDFTEFASKCGFGTDGYNFVPRRIYGDYLRATLHNVMRRQRPDCGADLLAEEAVALIKRPGDRLLVGMRHGSHLEVDHAILAVGPPGTRAPWASLEVQASNDYKLVSDPWAPGALDTIAKTDRVLLIGTGLTMVDVVLTLDQRGHTGQLTARSRHGLLPLGQRPTSYSTIDPSLDASAQTARALVATIRAAAEKAEFAGEDWRGLIAGVRANLPRLWAGLSESEQLRILRHGARYWEIHRHRMAPEVLAKVSRLRGVGRLSVGAGRLQSLETDKHCFLACMAHDGGRETLQVDAVVNCTGPGSANNYEQSSRLVAHLLNSGMATTDSLGLGLHVNADGDLVDALGLANPRIHSLGWVRRGQRYESTAIPEIRAQAEALADRLVGSAR